MSIYLDEFETLYGISENIEKLRSKILDYAFKGKLIKKNKNKKSAKDLVESIRNSRKEMIKNKEIRKPRGGVDSVDLDKAPHTIPNHWEWDKIGYIFNIYNGDSINRKLKERKYMKVKEGYDYIGTKDVGYHGEINYKTDVKIPLDEKDDFSIAPPNRPLICCEGGSAGKKIGFTDNYISFGNKLFAVESFENFNYKFLFYYYQSNTFYEQFKSKLKGIIGGVSMGRFREIYLPIPPLEEQKRIVDKIEKLMKEVDKLEEKLEEKEEVSQNLSESIVETIKSSQDAEELEENLRFIINNFDVIFKTSESMDEIRNIVLQLAIEGKLVPQNESDEPASELVKKIEKERKKLKEEGELKKPRGKINNIEKSPFDIPSSWEWLSLGITSNIVMGQSPKGDTVNEDPNNGIEFHQGKSYYGKKILKNSFKFTSDPKKISYSDSIIISVRAPVGALNYNDRKICIGRGLASIKPHEQININYLYYSILTQVEKLKEKSKGSTFKAITAKILLNLKIPIPPLEEQKRIVNKVDSIMEIIDKLEKELIKKEDLVEKLGTI